MPDGAVTRDILQQRRDSAFEMPWSDQKLLIRKAMDIIEQCRASSGVRAAYCRQINSIVETGRQDGTRSLINMLYQHHDRLAAYMFSPAEMRFGVDFENEYPPDFQLRGNVAARMLTRDFERTNADMLFAEGVFEALKYGATIFKQTVQQDGEDRIPHYPSSLVMPWMFGVFNESINELERQPAMTETVLLTLPEVWRRIWYLPDAGRMFERIKTHSQRGQSGDEYNSFFHQILSTSTLNTGNVGMTHPVPGGIVQLNNDPNYAIIGPEIAAPLVRMHELWIWGAEDWETIQIIEPDILVYPKFKRGNLLGVKGHHPYKLIQSNKQVGYLWGRPECVDLIEPQGLLSTWADDIKRLFGLQIDKILAFTGDGVTDEEYDQMRAAGFLNLGASGQVKDVTPTFPPESLQMLEFIMKVINMLGGFDNILSGQGEPGVRAGNHANTLLQTASPRLKDRSLILERQCASAADLRLSLMEAKDGRRYWTEAMKREETGFLLSDLPDDRRVVVDSHSTSPIFQNNHEALIGNALKAGIVDGEYVLEMLPFPQKDVAIRRLKERQAKQQELMQQLMQRDPEAAAKAMAMAPRR